MAEADNRKTRMIVTIHGAVRFNAMHLCCAAIVAAIVAATGGTGTPDGTPSHTENQLLLASDGTAHDGFGKALDRDGDTLIIGAPQQFSSGLPASFYVVAPGTGSFDGAPPADGHREFRSTHSVRPAVHERSPLSPASAMSASRIAAARTAPEPTPGRAARDHNHKLTAIGGGLAAEGFMLQAKTIAQRGQPAPGFEKEGLLFEDFGMPSNFPTSPHPAPRIDRHGNVSFVGIVSEDGVPGSGETPIPVICRFANNELELIAQPGDPAPGTDSVFQGFPGPPGFPLESTPLISEGALALFASLQGSSGSSGVWSDRFGELEFVLHQGDMLPAPPGATMHVHSFATGFEGDQIVVNAAVNSAATDGLWRNGDGSFEVIAIDGVPAPGVGPDISFGEGTQLAFFGAVDGWDMNEAGAVVFQGYLMGPPIECGNGICEAYAWPYPGENCLNCPEDCAGVQTGNPNNQFCCGNGGGQNPVGCDDPRCNDGDFTCDAPPPPVNENNDEGIWAEGSEGLYLLVREGDPAPLACEDCWFGSGGNGESGGLETFSPQTSIAPRINDEGAVLFGGRITSPEFYVKTSLWGAQSGSLELIATAATGLGDPNFPGDPAPGLEQHDATFREFFVGDLNNDGDMAIFATAIFNGQPLVGTTGIWWDLPGELQLVAALGEPVPGIPGAVYEAPIFPVTHAGSGWDWLLFTSRYTGAAMADNMRPVFRATADGEVTLALQPGMEILVDSDELKIVSSYQGGGHTDDGEYVFEMTFTDGTHGLYVIDLIPPFGNHADLNGDGSVGIADLLILLADWGPCTVSADCPADLSEDGDVGVADLLILLANWT